MKPFIMTCALVLGFQYTALAFVRDVHVDVDKPSAFTTFDPLKSPTALKVNTHKITTDLDPSPSSVEFRAPLALWLNTVHTTALHVHEAVGIQVGARFYMKAHGKFLTKDEGSGPQPDWFSHAVDIDLDADTDQTGLVEGSQAEETVEETGLGAIVCVDPEFRWPQEVVVRKVMPPGCPAGDVILRKKSGSGDVIIKMNDTVIISGEQPTSQNLWGFVAGADLSLKMFGKKEGEVVLEVKYSSNGLEQDTEYEDIVKITVIKLDPVLYGVEKATESMLTSQWTFKENIDRFLFGNDWCQMLTRFRVDYLPQTAGVKDYLAKNACWKVEEIEDCKREGTPKWLEDAQNALGVGEKDKKLVTIQVLEWKNVVGWGGGHG